MKLTLVVLTTGKWEGKELPITVPQFVIGRDPECNLRPASPIISKRHCAILVRGDQIFVRDFGSTNGTFLNSDRVEGERALENGDQLSIGPLLFRVQLERTPSVDKLTPVPPTRTSAKTEEDELAAALLLSAEEGGPAPGSAIVDGEGVPTGSTVMETIAVPDPTAASASASGGAEREKAAKAASADTSTAAKAILEKYLRRPRGT
jgi:pSer/pThr/pTyr-binding forkhead associated (FHA) protein